MPEKDDKYHKGVYTSHKELTHKIEVTGQRYNRD